MMVFKETKTLPLQASTKQQQRIQIFIAALGDFAGNILEKYGQRVVYSSDNSIYQQIPTIIIQPQNIAALVRVLALRATKAFCSIPFTVRGGGTGTNGQSLTRFIVIDTSLLQHIHPVDIATKTLWVEAGVIHSLLQERLRVDGLTFPPELSTSTRATIGGMIATNASGKGSCVFGRTADYICALDVVLTDGSRVVIPSRASTTELAELHPMLGEFAQLVTEKGQPAIAEFLSKTAHLPRAPAGYQLANVAYNNGDINCVQLWCGSEGSLGVVVAAQIRVITAHIHRAVIVTEHAAFSQALDCAQPLARFKAAAIETLDQRVIGLAHSTQQWIDVAQVFALNMDTPSAINIIECSGNDIGLVQRQIAAIQQWASDNAIAHAVSWRAADIAAIWDLRANSVGLLAKMPSRAKPVAFIEDTAVAPEHLSAYVAELTKLLDNLGVAYGMFGHVDAGCLHVRPALDTSLAADRQLVVTITDAVIALLKKYNGVLWGEHGKGYRSAYAPEYFGDALQGFMNASKQCFDPFNICNPGKIAHPTGGDLVAIDAVPMHGESFAAVSDNVRNMYQQAFACNGNAACLNQSTTQLMCPSYQITQDRVQSPKGRAVLLRQWLVERVTGDQNNLEAELYISLASCLGCQGCTTGCPVEVDIPKLKSLFLQEYYQKHRMPLREWCISCIEECSIIGGKVPAISNILMRFSALLGMHHLPRWRPPQSMHNHNITQPSCVVAADPYTWAYDGGVIDSLFALLASIGENPQLLPVLPWGKAAATVGAMNKAAAQRAAVADLVSQQNVPVIVLESAVSLTTGNDTIHNAVTPVADFLAQRLAKLPQSALRGVVVQLCPHCSEQALFTQLPKQWQLVFEHCGAAVSIVTAGCCGMAGAFGHRKEYLKMSADIFKRNWQPSLDTNAIILATGFSCRSQLHKNNVSSVHPVELLAKTLHGK